MQYYNILSDSLKTVSGTDAELLSSKPQSDRLLHELKMEVNSVRPLKQNIIPSGENIIEFRGVTFSYANSNQTVIDNLSFAIKKGKRVAITGKSGAGKTTVLKLMSGMLRPSSGEVLFYGENVGDIDLYSLHKHLGFIMQENILFNAAIKENLLYAKADASTDEIETACQKAFIWDFIKTLPDGLETIIGERGIKLSGGQKQRLILARQFLRGTNDMFILDEATSALDQYSESIIQDAISSIGQDKTIIVVAHRKSSISLCDRVIEL
jgi:ABC-type bacteriocin/lantibiotic exporter with double-glycine peptidase domain